MIENIKIKVIESHEEILNLINKPIGTLVNFDFHADYPLYPEKIFDDIDSYSEMISKHYSAWLDSNWVPILVSRGYVSQYIWLYPHDHARDTIKRFDSRKGRCLVYNIKFNGCARIHHRYITIDADFFGCRVPLDWNPENREELFMNILNSLTARNLTIIISKSLRYINYDIENFLENILEQMEHKANVETI